MVASGASNFMLIAHQPKLTIRVFDARNPIRINFVLTSMAVKHRHLGDLRRMNKKSDEFEYFKLQTITSFMFAFP
jgi:hypothetical protein